MIRINLLPTPRGRRELRRQLTLAAAAMILTVLGGVWLYNGQQRELESKHRELRRIEAELKRLEKIVKEVQEFETRKASLEEKRNAISNLHTAQRRPARMLDEVSRLLPEQVWIIEFREGTDKLSITGKSFDNVGIASFMENLERSPLFEGVGLVESKSEVLQGREVKAFTVNMRILLPSPTNKENVS